MDTTRKIVLLVICINIVLYGFGIRVIGNNQILENFVNIEEENGEIKVDGVSNNIINKTPTQSDGFISGTVTDFVNYAIDPIKAIWGFITFIINIMFAVVGIFTSVAGMPNIIGLFLGVPLLVLYVYGFIYIIRGARG